MTLKSIGILLASVFSAGVSAPIADSNFLVLRDRLRDLEISGWRTPLEEVPSEVGRILASQSEEGTFEGVVYETKERAAFPAIEHVKKLSAMARVWVRLPDSNPEKRTLLAGIEKGICFWRARDPQSPNWWWNTIGLQMNLLPTLLAGDGSFSASARKDLAELYARSRPEQIPESFRNGQNLVWLANFTLARGVFLRDAEEVSRAVGEIASEIRIAAGKGEGIKPDFSFHQHEEQIYNGGYGSAFLADTARLVVLTAGTPWALSPERIGILSSLILEGNRWMLFKKTMDFGVRSREIVRPIAGEVRPHSLGNQALQIASALSGEERSALERVGREIAAGDHALAGNRVFPRSDYVVHRDPGFMVTVKMTSRRIRGSECGNGEGMLSLLLSDGLTWLYREDGLQYHNVFPVWDWQRLPGITAEVREVPRLMRDGGYQPYASNDFAGAVSEGGSGAAAMELARETLRAKKSWFFHGKDMVALGAGIEAAGEAPIETSVEQCRLRGETARSGEGPELARDEWIWHDGAAYRNRGETAVAIHLGEQEGHWQRIHKGQKAIPVKMEVLRLGIAHGVAPKGASYAYQVSFDPLPAWKARANGNLPQVVKNAEDVQAVSFLEARIDQVVFHREATVRFRDDLSVSASAPALVQLRKEGAEWILSVADPLQTQASVKIEVVTMGVRKSFVIDLPGGDEAGRTQVRRWK